VHESQLNKIPIASQGSEATAQTYGTNNQTTNANAENALATQSTNFELTEDPGDLIGSILGQIKHISIEKYHPVVIQGQANAGKQALS